MTAEEEAAYAREFKNGNFYRNVYLPHIQEKKREIISEYTKVIVKNETQAAASLSGKLQLLIEEEEWLETLFKRSPETKGS